MLKIFYAKRCIHCWIQRHFEVEFDPRCLFKFYLTDLRAVNDFQPINQEYRWQIGQLSHISCPSSDGTLPSLSISI